ncbi:MAG: EamA family transporter RarD [Fimbriiglobus sp.]|nr:EamA family transporter RarD [Fimbriiglobus sp.]
MSAPSPTQFRSGLLFGVIAYMCWGAVPLYFAQVKTVPALEILAHRISWSMPLMLGVVALTPGGFASLRRVLRTRKLLLGLLASALLLSGNWLLYIYATVTQQVAEASLGYYMMPLANAFLATVFLGEKLRRLHYPALALIAIGVAVPLFAAGRFSWLALALPLTFGLYGLVRKKLPVDSGTGLTVETLLLSLPCIAYIATHSAIGDGLFLKDLPMTGWLLFGGVVTVVPLLTFTLSVRRIPLLTQSFIQFLSPTVQLLLAVTILGESMTWDRWAAMGCVWVAVAVFITDAVIVARRNRTPRPLSAVEIPLSGGVR